VIESELHFLQAAIASDTSIEALGLPIIKEDPCEAMEQKYAEYNPRNHWNVIALKMKQKEGIAKYPEFVSVS